MDRAGLSVALCMIVLSGTAGCATTSYAPAIAQHDADTLPVIADELSLRVADASQQAAVVAGDVSQIRGMMHPNYLVNAPTNRVMSATEILAMFDKGIITAEPVERSVEAVMVTGTTGIVMGRESLVPVPGSQLAKVSGDQPILRRFTNIYSFEKGRWQFISRHFNEVRR